MEPKKACAYIRVSSEDQKNEGLSLDMQRSKLIHYANENQYVLYKIYEDAGISGGSIDKRPSFKQLIADAIEKKFEVVLMVKFDRAFRNVGDAIKILDMFHVNKIDLISLTEKIDTTTAFGRATFQIISVFAELERNMTTERVKLINVKKFEDGKMIGKAPIGYKWSKTKKEYVIDEKKAEIVKEVFNMTLQGIRWKDICDKFGLSSQTYYNILKNKAYIGIIKYDKQEIKGKHEPLIPEDVFYRINNRTIVL